MNKYTFSVLVVQGEGDFQKGLFSWTVTCSTQGCTKKIALLMKTYNMFGWCSIKKAQINWL